MFEGGPGCPITELLNTVAVRILSLKIAAMGWNVCSEGAISYSSGLEQLTKGER